MEWKFRIQNETSVLTFRQSVFQWINRISLRNYRFSMFIGHILVKMMWPPKITQWQRNINWTLYIKENMH